MKGMDIGLRDSSPFARTRPARTKGFSQVMMNRLSTLRKEIASVDRSISVEASKFIQKNKRQPTEVDLQQNPKVSVLIERREQLKTRYIQLVEQNTMVSSASKPTEQKQIKTSVFYQWIFSKPYAQCHTV